MSSSVLVGLPLVNKAGTKVSTSELQGKVIAFYFSAHWCPPCRGFTPALKKFYEALKASGKPFEIIFVSGDKSEGEFKEYFESAHGDWLALEFDAPQKKSLSEKYGVRGIPHLQVVDSKGEPLSAVKDARSDVSGAATADAALAVFNEWSKHAGDWRETAGTALGGAAPAKDAAAMRAARLAALEKRAGGNATAAVGGGNPAGAGGYSGGAAAPVAVVAPQPTVPTNGCNPADPGPTAASAASPPAPQAPAHAPPSAPAAAPAASPAVSADAIKTLTEMGFVEEQARAALEQTNGDLDNAVMLLVQ